MKANLRLSVVFAGAIIAATVIAYAQLGQIMVDDPVYYQSQTAIEKAGRERNLAALMDAAKQARSQLDGKGDVVAYSKIAAVACARIGTDFPNARAEAQSEAETAISHIDALTSTSMPVGVMDGYWKLQMSRLGAKYGQLLGRHQSTTDGEWIAQRQETAKAMILTLSLVEKGMDQKWDRTKAPTMHADIPESSPIRISGMSPEAIQDPAIRAEFEKNIREHDDKLRAWQDQKNLRALRARMISSFRSGMADMYSTPPFANDELRAMLESKSTSAGLEAQILDVVNTRITEHNKSIVNSK